jgi:hypothetical protein
MGYQDSSTNQRSALSLPMICWMKHAGQDALDRLEPLLEELRSISGLVERKRGLYYRNSRAFLHFHEDPSGLYADVRVGEDFERYRVETAQERSTLLAIVKSE